jgi:hypothetical protein
MSTINYRLERPDHPAVIQQFDSTVFIPTSHKAEVDAYKTLSSRSKSEGGEINEKEIKEKSSSNCTRSVTFEVLRSAFEPCGRDE